MLRFCGAPKLARCPDAGDLASVPRGWLECCSSSQFEVCVQTIGATRATDEARHPTLSGVLPDGRGRARHPERIATHAKDGGRISEAVLPTQRLKEMSTAAEAEIRSPTASAVVRTSRQTSDSGALARAQHVIESQAPLPEVVRNAAAVRTPKTNPIEANTGTPAAAIDGALRLDTSCTSITSSPDPSKGILSSTPDAAASLPQQIVNADEASSARGNNMRRHDLSSPDPTLPPVEPVDVVQSRSNSKPLPAPPPPPMPRVLSVDTVPDMASMHPMSRSVTAHEEEDLDMPVEFGSGQVRVLLVVGSSTGAHGRQVGLDGAFKIEQWCHRCGITDVTVLVLSGPSDVESSIAELGRAAQTLASRCHAGDVCVLHLAGLEAVCQAAGLTSESAARPKGGSPDSLHESSCGKSAIDAAVAVAPGGDAEGAAQAAQAREIPLETTFSSLLPASCSVVCIADSRPGAALLGFSEDQVRQEVVVPQRLVFFLVCPERSSDLHVSDTMPHAGFCANAMIRSANALSLTDGPCSLACSAFFAEVSEQARDLFAAAGLPQPHIALLSVPSEDTANEVRWPIAALPKTPAKGVRLEAPQDPVLTQPVHTSAMRLESEPPNVVSDAGKQPRVRSLSPTAGRSGPPECQALCTRKGRKSCRGGSQKTRPSSHGRALPADLGSLSLMLTGGGLADPASGPKGPRRQAGARHSEA